MSQKKPPRGGFFDSLKRITSSLRLRQKQRQRQPKRHQQLRQQQEQLQVQVRQLVRVQALELLLFCRKQPEQQRQQ